MSQSERPRLAVVTPNTQRREQVLRKRLPKPIVTVQQRSRLRLHELLSTCFATSDDHFFDLAKTALQQEDQDGYFCALTELRNKKSKVFETFFDGLERSFLALADIDELRPTGDAFAAASIDQLAIVGNDDLDQLVAKEAMVHRAFNQCKVAVEQLARRFDAVVPVDVGVEQLPVSPAHLCELFIKACKTLDINTRSFMVLFKLFERSVLQQLNSLYSAMNSHLEERGILPGNAGARTYSKPATKGPATQGPVSGADTPVEEAFLHLDASMLGAPFAGSGRSPASAGAATGDARHPNARGGGANLQPGVKPKAKSDPAPHQRPTGSAHSVTSDRCETTIASILTVLAGRQDLAQPFIPLLQQLQQPIVQVAKNDNTFFSDHHHAARRLLNALSTSALAFDRATDDIEGDPLFAKIKAVIAKLQSSVYSQPQAMEALAKEFEQFVHQEKRRADLYEKRMLDAEQGKHKAQVCRQQVLTTIAEITQGMELRASVRQIIDKAWYQVMFVTALKHGAESRQWDHASQTLIDLVTSTQPYVNHAERTYGLQSLEGLKARVRRGLESLFFDAFEIDKVVAQLDDTIRQLAQEEPTPTQQTIKIQARMSPSPVAVEPKPPAPDISDVFVSQAMNLSRGSWFDLLMDTGPTRCRLAAIIGAYEKYIFVQRDGSKIAEHTLPRVAEALATQKLVALDSNRIFDQALEQVIAGMRQ